MSDPAALTATEAARALRAGTLTAAALAEALLDRVAAREPELRAFVHHDPESVRRAAALADRRGMSGPLHGLHLGVKDVLDTADMPSAYGSPIWAGHRPRSDSAAVALARDAGAVVAGKTVTTEFATRTPGPTANPLNPAHTPGGSSSGSAAAVAAGFCHAAYGTQTAGSIVRPAAYCGVVGYKPSYGSIHRAGMKVMSESLDTIGVLARGVADCALFAGAVAGRDLGDPEVPPGRAPRLLLTPGFEPGALAPETAALLARVADAARRAGAVVEDWALPPALHAAAAAHPAVMNIESAQALAWELRAARAQVSATLLEKMDWGRSQPPGTLESARAAFAAGQAAFRDALEGWDAVLTPSAPGEAPEGLGWTGDPVCNLLWTALHGPCVTVPAGVGPKGLPLGVQIVTRPGEDRQALAWARWLQHAL
ncbi:amidase [Roseomonas sp. NAR14]|uniref:Amidase n=1 Tax=Roseomonas acroporae TaxID=2937791 RepID=A0A9X1Y7F4_9PROT|nr:amidase [Roseomonas acroporae]MCK8784938.1 amidase [Roseomonas acroporae]